MRDLLRWIRRLLFPPKCAGCGRLLDWWSEDGSSRAICEKCEELWENEKTDTCDRCAKRVSHCSCMTDFMKQAKCDSFRKLGYYRRTKKDAVMSRLLYRMKRTRDRETAAFLADALLPALREQQAKSRSQSDACLITFIPRGVPAKLETGTDQAEALARALSACAGIRFCRVIQRRRGKNRQQKSLSATARIQNARETFCIDPRCDLSGKICFLVDDIVTTGAGMATCARLLRRAGAKEVHCLSVASDDYNQSRV